MNSFNTVQNSQHVPATAYVFFTCMTCKHVDEVKDASKLPEPECPICLRRYGESGERPMRILACGHVVGHDCLSQNMNEGATKNKCPCCRALLFAYEDWDGSSAGFDGSYGGTVRNVSNLPPAGPPVLSPARLPDLSPAGFAQLFHDSFEAVKRCVRDTLEHQDMPPEEQRQFQLHVRPGIFWRLSKNLDEARWLWPRLVDDLRVPDECVDAFGVVGMRCADVVERWGAAEILSEEATRSRKMASEMHALMERYTAMHLAKRTIRSDLEQDGSW